MSAEPHCPTCTCTDTFRIDTAAPFYNLVIEVDRLLWDDIIRRRRERDAA